ncbi:MAG TPA: response regulator [Anaerolineales bacterium]|nr:response regulator [Anaerolineae bacterium]HIQ01303.1 response regulator [Anaerolineales bacterium]
MAPQHILIVEDEPNTAEMLVSYFEARGYRVTAVGWGGDALTFTKEVLPDLIVLDIRLPDMDGYEVCRRLRSHRRTAQVPIIFLTERRERIDRLAGLELGAVDYVTKPFDIQELRLRVRNALRRTRLEPVVHPVTGLPFFALVEERLTDLLKEKRWGVVAVALDGLEAFADVYGFVARDDVLRAVALMVQRVADEAGGRDPFVGQLDDTVFFITVTPEHVARVQERLAGRLQEALVFFYPRTDWESGQSQGGGPLPRLSVQVGTLIGPGPYQDLGALREAIQRSLVPSS